MRTRKLAAEWASEAWRRTACPYVSCCFLPSVPSLDMEDAVFYQELTAHERRQEFMEELGDCCEERTVGVYWKIMAIVEYLREY